MFFEKQKITKICGKYRRSEKIIKILGYANRTRAKPAKTAVV